MKARELNGGSWTEEELLDRGEDLKQFRRLKDFEVGQ